MTVISLLACYFTISTDLTIVTIIVFFLLIV